MLSGGSGVKPVSASETYLTQEEVHALLQMEQDQSPYSPDEAQTEAVPFDFHRPEKMSKEHEQSLRVIQSTFARNMSGSLSSFMRSVVRVELADLEESSYETFLAGIGSPSLMAVCSLPQLDGKILFVIDPALALVFVDRLMGGQGDVASEERELTEIEVSLLGRVLERILASLHDAWVNVIDITPTVDQMESSPHFVQLVPGTDTVIAVTFNVAFRAAEGVIKFCVPFHILKPLIPKLHEHLWFQDHDKPTGDAASIAEVRGHVLATTVDLQAELGGADISVAELLDLQVGDCVVLDRREGDELPLNIGCVTRLWGHLGVKDHKYAISITRWNESAVIAANGNGGGKP